MHAIDIRQAHPGDAPAVSQLRLEALRAHPEAFSSDYQVESARSPADWEASIRRADGTAGILYLAYVGQEPAGMAASFRGHYRYLTERPETGRHQLYLTGRNMTVGQLVYTMRANELDAETAAKDLGLPVEQVKEALAYHETHRDLIESEAEEERRSLPEHKVVRVEVPEEWLQDLEGDRSTMMHEILWLGIYQLKVRRALEMYQAGAGSLGYVAEKTGLSKRDLVREARARGIEPTFDEQTVRKELGQ